MTALALILWMVGPLCPVCGVSCAACSDAHGWAPHAYACGRAGAGRIVPSIQTCVPDWPYPGWP